MVTNLLLPFLISGAGTAGFVVMMLIERAKGLRASAFAKRDRVSEDVSRRADRDHSRTMRGDPRGMYGKYPPPPGFADITEDDQFVDEWDHCELCPKRGRAQAVSDKGKPLGPGPNKPVAVFSGTAQAPVEPMRLCAICYRECAYGIMYRDRDDLPVPKPADFDANLRAWLDAEGEWIEAVDDWLEVERAYLLEKRLFSPQQDNVTDFQEAAKRLGHDMAAKTRIPHQNFAVGPPVDGRFTSPAQRAQAATADMLAKLIAMGVVPGSMIAGLDASKIIPTAPCPGCERIFMHGDPHPARIVCSGSCKPWSKET